MCKGRHVYSLLRLEAEDMMYNYMAESEVRRHEGTRIREGDKKE